MDDLTRLYNTREQIEIMMEICVHPSSQDELKERLDEVNRQIVMLENEQEENNEQVWIPGKRLHRAYRRR